MVFTPPTGVIVTRWGWAVPSKRLDRLEGTPKVGVVPTDLDGVEHPLLGLSMLRRIVRPPARSD
jgi:hypothetical protein